MCRPEYTQQLREALEPVYEAVSLESKHPSLPVCDIWSREALPVIRQVASSFGGHILHIVYEPTTFATEQYGIIKDYHEYIIDISNPENPINIDGTWQQYCPPNTTVSAHRILVASAVDIPHVLETTPVKRVFFDIWRSNLFSNRDIFRIK